jgi:hypothetical protein
MDVCLSCVLSGRGLCDELITSPEESYRLWRVITCDQETSCNDEAIARAGLQSQDDYDDDDDNNNNNNIRIMVFTLRVSFLPLAIN